MRSFTRPRVARILAAAVMLLAGAVASLAAQGTGTIQGRVTDAGTQRPLSGAQVSLVGTTRRAVTNEAGEYTFGNVATGATRVRAEMIGHSNAEQAVTVAAGQTARADFALMASALQLDAIVVTGVTDPTAGTRTPFNVGRVGADRLQVPASGSPIQAIQGKVAGVRVVRGSGQPGSGVSVQLRTPTSIQKSSSPLVVVDGVILGASSVDISALDVESVEVLKGAAAASLYGSRAAAGVIQIRTSRGRNLEEGKLRLTARSEFGSGSLERQIALTRSHEHLISNGQYVDARGTVITDRSRRVQTEAGFQDQPYPGEVFDPQNQIFGSGLFHNQSFSLAQNLGKSNYFASFNQEREYGIVQENQGLTSRSFRLGMDQRVGDRLDLGFSVYHLRSSRDDIGYTTGQNSGFFFDALLMPRDVNLLARDSTGQYLQQPDPTAPLENPLWRLTSREIASKRERTLASANARFRAFSWLSFDGDVAYDRSNRFFSNYLPKGTPILSGTDPQGQINNQNNVTDGFNAAAGATLKHSFGELSTRTALRAAIEREDDYWFRAEGQNLLTRGVPDLDQAQTRFVGSSFEGVRSTGYFVNTGFDYAGKYISDFLVRRDGSSLFGPENRWKTYYRASLAWRMTEESWWPLAGIDEFKPRYSIGTAGGRPEYADQYETYTVTATGISLGNKGNRELKPEHSREHEAGLDIVGFNRRASLQLTYSNVVTTDQIIQLPPRGVTGFFSQWANGGTLEGDTYEATLEAELVKGRNLSWSATFIADRSRHEITEWNRSCFVTGVTYRCQGETLGLFYGRKHLRDLGQLSEAQRSSGEFVVNDDGYVVWVGKGNSYTDGVKRDEKGNLLWNTSGTVNGVSYRWGQPIVLLDSLGQPALVKVGDTQPNYHFGLTNDVRIGNFSIFGQLDSQLGAQVYNSVKQRMYQYYRHADVDQAGKPEEMKKPVSYYFSLYNGNNVTEHFVENGSYVKLREMSVKYALRQSQLPALRQLGMGEISLGLVGRNLFTWTSFSGFDPEVGSVTLAEQGFTYPNFRTLTASVELKF